MRLETERLILRSFTDADRAAVAEMDADPEVMRFYPGTRSRAQVDAMIDSILKSEAENGFCFMAAEDRATHDFVGLIGMARLAPAFSAVLKGQPEVEIGWRIGKRFWGKRLAPEGARACLDFGWNQLGLDEIVAFTYAGNAPSRRVMEKIGMSYDAGADFDNPNVPEGHPIRPHVLYRIGRPEN